MSWEACPCCFKTKKNSFCWSYKNQEQPNTTFLSPSFFLSLHLYFSFFLLLSFPFFLSISLPFYLFLFTFLCIHFYFFLYLFFCFCFLYFPMSCLPLYFIFQPSNAKERWISLSFHQPLSIPTKEEEWYLMKEVLTLEKCCEKGCL